MTLATHGIAGALIANQLTGDPVAGFIAGFLSHFLLDAIPHWDYKILSLQKDENDPLKDRVAKGGVFILDLIRTGTDFFLGFALILLASGMTLPSLVVIAGYIGGVMPDALQLAYWKIRREPLISLQRFHIFIHAEKKIRNPFIGITLQATLILLLFYLTGGM